MAMSQPASEANTAIPAIVPDAQDSGDLACPPLPHQMSFAANGGYWSSVCVCSESLVSVNAASCHECHILLKKFPSDINIGAAVSSGLWSESLHHCARYLTLNHANLPQEQW